MTGDGDRRSDARRPEREADASQAARESMLARHKLIEAMIDNNLRQLKFDSARGGAEIERACALRDVERGGDDSEPTERLPGSGRRIEGAAGRQPRERGGDDSEPTERLAEIDRRIERLEDEHRSLVAEREWLNRSLLEFDDQATANGRFLI